MSTWRTLLVDWGLALVQLVAVLPSMAGPALPVFDQRRRRSTPSARACVVDAVGCPLTLISSTDQGVLTSSSASSP